MGFLRLPTREEIWYLIKLFVNGVIEGFIMGFWLYIFVIVGTFFYTKPLPTAAWDLPGLGEELTARVYGQDDAVRALTRSIQNLADDPRRAQQHRVVFLLGGPGVGKSHVIEIIKNHVYCENPDNTTCQIQFEESDKFNTFVPDANWIHFKEYLDTKGMLFWAAEFESLEKYINNPDDTGLAEQLSSQRTYYPFTNVFNTFRVKDRVFYVVTGSVFNNTVMSAIRSEADYDFYLKDAARRLEIYMFQHAPDVHFSIISFRPLTKDHVTRCLRDQKVGTKRQIKKIVAKNSREDIVPLGCKVHQEFGTK